MSNYSGIESDGGMDPREWVPLTEQEIGELYRAGWSNNMDFARGIEAKLKEKNSKQEGNQIADHNAELRECVKELFDKYLNRREESDSGRMFAPVQVSSVRVMLVEPLGELLEKMRVLSGAEKAQDYK